MQYARDITTIEEVLSTDEETLNKVLDVTYYDQKPGDLFFIKDKPDKIYLIEDIELIDGDYYLVYYGGEKIFYEDTLPLFTSGNLVDMLQAHQLVEVRTFRGGWLLIFDNVHIYTSEEDELLVSFLWRALKDLVVRDKLH